MACEEEWEKEWGVAEMCQGARVSPKQERRRSLWQRGTKHVPKEKVGCLEEARI